MKVVKKKKNLSQRTTSPNSLSGTTKLAFIEHAYELRRRLYYIVASVVMWGTAIYAVQQHVVNALLRPAHGQHFIYTSVGGGIDFLFRISIYGGIILSLPVIVYNGLRFIEPLIHQRSRRFIALGSLVSGLLVIAGMVFGYFIGLPATLHFLLYQFTTVQIQPLVTIQSYLHFVIVYMFGSAMLFQLPLLLIFINRIKPLKPKRLLHYERWVILAAFVLAGLMNPTPNIISQLLVAGPFIIMYQIGILLIVFLNRPKRTARISQLIEQDKRVRAQRLEQARTHKPLLSPTATLLPSPSSAPALTKDFKPRVIIASGTRRGNHQTLTRPVSRHVILPRQRFMDFAPRSNQSLAPEG